MASPGPTGFIWVHKRILTGELDYMIIEAEKCAQRTILREVASVDHSKDKGWSSRNSDVGRQRTDVSEVGVGRKREKKRGGRTEKEKAKGGKGGRESENRMGEERQDDRIAEEKTGR